MPLMESHAARVFIEDTYTGVTRVPASQPGGAIRLNLGRDKNFEIKSTFVLPRQGSRSEDRSQSWFVTDKVKYNVELVEYAFSAHSTHSAPHLLLLSEYLPHVADEEIKVELLQPSKEAMVQVSEPNARWWCSAMQLQFSSSTREPVLQQCVDTDKN